MNAFGIDPADWSSIIEVFARTAAVTRVRIFGSRALATHRPGSDIDLALEGNSLDLAALHLIQREYENLYLPWKLDLLIYDDLAMGALREHIDRVGVEVYRA